MEIRSVARKVFVFTVIEGITDFFVRQWITSAAEAILKRRKFVAALSGGKTPIPAYQAAARAQAVEQWEKTHLFLVDERFVPFHDPASNYRMLREHLMKRTEIPEGHVHPIPFDGTIAGAAKKYEEDIQAFFNIPRRMPPIFDLAVLGMGEDGHTASLFPGSAALSEKNRLAVPVRIAGLANERITMTLPVINNARKIIFLITGKHKAPAVKEIVEDRESCLPAAAIRPHAGELLFLMDKEAGSLLGEESKTAIS